MWNANTEPDRRDPVAAAFAHPAFATLKPLGAPSMLVASGPFRVVWANAFAADVFGAADCGDLARRLSGSSGGMVQRLSHLLERLDPGGSPRLERLRFVQSLISRTITVLCQRVECFGADGLAVAVLGFEQGIGAEGLALWRRSASGSQEASLPAVHDAPPQPHVPLAALVGTPAVRDALRDALGGREQGRFVWRTDAQGAVLQADAETFAALGAAPVPAVGLVLSDVVRRFDAAAADRLSAALASPTTWSGIDVLWPVASGAAALPLVLRAAPWFDGGRDFAGFRGFGTFDLAAIRPRAETAPLAEAAFAPQTLVDRPEPVRPAPGEAGPAPDSAVSDAAAAPTAPTESDAGLFAPLANVVRLWPLSAVRALLPVPDTSAVAPEPEDMAPPDLPPEVQIIEPLPVHAPAGSLTSSEHEAFEEIGRALSAGTPGPAAVAALADLGDAEPAGSPPPEPAAVPPAPIPVPVPVPEPVPEDDFSRNAAALVETTTAGLMVVRGRMLLFANQALLDLLRYPTHADFEVAVGAALAQSPPGRTEDEAASVVLPTHDGEATRFAVASRPIQWSGGAAQLLTLRPGDAAPAEAPAAPPAWSTDARALLDATGDAVALIDGHGAVLMLNQLGERWFGRDRSRLAGESFTLLLAVESRAAAAAMLSEVQASKIPAAEARRDVTARSPEGPVLALDMRLARLGQDRFSVVWRDLSALRRSERDVAQAVSDAERVSDRQPELLAKLSHQIRTPLNAIIGFAEVMMDERFGTLGNPRYKDYLKDIHASGTQVMSLVNDLLDLSQIEAGRHELDLGAVDINRVIGECVTQIQSEAHRGRVIVRTSFSPRQPMVMADDRATRQIIGNLLSNAVKFNEPGGQVIVSTTTGEGGVALVRIRDTGIGMSEKDIASALEPFRQLAPSRAAEGTGLGLPLTKALVGANGASLSIRSRPGEGTMVEVTFQPAATPARVPA